MNIKETNLMLRQNSASTRELTTQAQERYSRGGPRFNRGGEIFMAEPGRGEGEKPKEPIQEGQTKQPIGQNDRSSFSSKATSSTAGVGGASNGGGEKPPAPPAGETPSETPPEGDSGVPEKKDGEPGETISKTDITDLQLLNYIERINDLIGSGEPEKDMLRMGLDAITKLQGVNETEKNEALKRIKEAFDKAPEQRREGLYGERKLTPSEKKQIESALKADGIEKLFNRMFDRVDARPQADFNEAFGNAGTFEFEEFMKTLNEAITANNEKGEVDRAHELNLIVQRFANEKKAREIIHNAYFGVMSGADTEGMSKFIDTFQTGWADLAFNKAGVTQAMHFYEQALLIVREKAGGYLRPKEVVGEMKKNSRGEVNELARKYLEDANSRGMLKGPGGKKLEPWEIDRALSFARGMSIIMGRTIEIAASSILPPGATAFTDQYAQRIIAELAPFRHSFKFFVRSKFSRILAYVMNRGKKPWDPKEIQEFDDLKRLKKIEQFDVLNGLVPDGQERFYSVLNPFEIGGILSRTGWRIEGSGVTMIDDLVRKEIEQGKAKAVAEADAWIGTGVQIERKRGKFVKKERSSEPFKAMEDAKEAEKARIHISTQLEIIAQRTPLRLFLNIRNVQEKVLGRTAERLKMPKEKLKELMSQTRDRDKPEDVENREKVEKFLQWVDELVLLQEEANQNKKPLNEFLSKASSDVQNFVKDIEDVWAEGEQKTFLKTLEEKEWKIPYTFGTEDVPYNEYNFEITGPRSIARRWGDMASAARASKAFLEFFSGIDHFKDQGQIVEAMIKIYDGIKGYNEDDAQKFMLRLAEGVVKFYKKGWQSRLPLGIGSLMSLVTGKSSYAQIAYGRGAMAWDELQVNEFTRLLRDAGKLTVEQQHELQEKVGGSKKEVAWAYARTVVPLIMLALVYYMLSKSLNEKN